VRLEPTAIEGLYLVAMDPIPDERGHFARLFDRDLLASRGLTAEVALASVSWNRRRHTLRGLHWQAAPHAEAKLVRCTRGSIHDVVVDVRPGSPTHRRWVAIPLSAREPLALYLGEGLAHGFLTLEDDTEVSYLLTAPYAPEAGRGARFDDPAFALAWPADPEVVSERDRAWPRYTPAP
jgi:dTDP-4-dehydrorhamnose 3,5-epimerase